MPRLFIEGRRRAAPTGARLRAKASLGKGEERPLEECGRLASSQTGRHLDASASGDRGEDGRTHGGNARGGAGRSYETDGLHAVVPSWSVPPARSNDDREAANCLQGIIPLLPRNGARNLRNGNFERARGLRCFLIGVVAPQNATYHTDACDKS